MTIRLCRACGDWHDPEAWPADCIPRRESKAAAFPVPMFTREGISVTSQLDGRTYTSRSELLAHYRRENVRIVEPGEKSGPPPVKPTTNAELAPVLKQHGII